MTQKFKGDALELKIEAAGKPAFDLTGLALDEFYDGAFTANDFLLMLYDSGRMPFSDRVPRDSFVAFFKEALARFPSTGTFESYIFIMKAIFGERTDVQFAVPAPGKIEMIVNAEAALDFGFQAREYVDGAYIIHDMVTMDGEGIIFQGISGIDSEAELTQLLAELIPAGIFADIALTFFTIDSFVAEYGGDTYFMVDHEGNQLVFFEE